jgi:hypothetical protein
MFNKSIPGITVHNGTDIFLLHKEQREVSPIKDEGVDQGGRGAQKDSLSTRQTFELRSSVELVRFRILFFLQFAHNDAQYVCVR